MKHDELIYALILWSGGFGMGAAVTTIVGWLMLR